MTTARSAVAGLLSLLNVGLSCSSAPARIRQISGCYAVTVGSWVVDPRNPTRPKAPPDTIRLSTKKVMDTSETRYQVQPGVFFAIGALVTIDGKPAHALDGYWKRSGDTIIIAWSNGIEGIGMRVTSGDSGLSGTVGYSRDVIVMDENRQVPSPSAPVRLVRSRCFTPDAA